MIYSVNSAALHAPRGVVYIKNGKGVEQII